MPITKINSLGITNPVSFSAGTAALPSITFSGDTNTGVFAPAADTIGFAEGGAEAMRIDSSGNVGIGTSSPAYPLDVSSSLASSLRAQVRNTFNGTSATSYFTLGNDSGASVAGLLLGSTTNNVFGNNVLAVYNAANAAVSFWTNNTERMSITSTGSLILVGSTAQKASGTSWSNPSDTRLKDNKQNYTKGLNELLQINVKTWEWNGKAGTTQGDVGIGVIADEIETILPNTIDTYKAKLNEDDTEQTDVKRFDATEITWLLLNSVKEQQAIIEQLKARLTALESK